jgi:hypothetical protein
MSLYVYYVTFQVGGNFPNEWNVSPRLRSSILPARTHRKLSTERTHRKLSTETPPNAVVAAVTQWGKLRYIATQRKAKAVKVWNAIKIAFQSSYFLTAYGTTLSASPNGTMIKDQWFERDVAGSASGLYLGVVQAFVWKAWGNHKKISDIQRSGFYSRRYQIFWEVVGLGRGPLSLMNTTEELLGRKSSGFGLETRDYGRRGSAAMTKRHPSIHKRWY